MDIMPLCIQTASIVIFLHFYNKLDFHILSRDGIMLGLSPSIKMSISSISGHSTFVLSSVNHRCKMPHLLAAAVISSGE